jgi:hypothetical protein
MESPDSTSIQSMIEQRSTIIQTQIEDNREQSLPPRKPPRTFEHAHRYDDSKLKSIDPCRSQSNSHSFALDIGKILHFLNEICRRERNESRHRAQATVCVHIDCIHIE